MTSKWKDSYLAYEHLQARWPTEGHRLLRDLVYRAEPPEYWVEHYILPRPDEKMVAEAVHIRPVIREAMRLVSFAGREPLEDVYHAAIYLASAPEHWEHAETCYRGQCNRAWPALPTLYRPPKGAQELTSEEYDLRLSKLAAFSEALNMKYPERFEPYQSIAIGQHYGLHTWLLDLTSDPWVGLFFASLGGEKDQVGVLARFSTIEWDRISSGGENSLGSMTLIAVPGVPRIEAQNALFLNDSHPDLIEQYVAEKLEFKQTEGLVFESDYKGVSKEKLLSDDESFATFTKEWLNETTPSIGFHVWHLARWADYLQEIINGRGSQLWEKENLATHWNIETKSLGYAQTGMGMDDKTAVTLRIPREELLLDYARRAFAVAERAVEGITDSEFHKIYEVFHGENWHDGHIGPIISTWMTHDNRHLGMIECLVGVQGAHGSADS